MKSHKDFSETLMALRRGERAARFGWNGKGQFVTLICGPNLPPGYQEHLIFVTSDGHNVPWVASQTDLLTADWFTF